MRGALLHHAIDPPPAALSGHAADGQPLERPHAAFLALPDFNSPEARDAIAGAAIALPREIDAGDRQAILLAAAHWERSGLRLLLGRLGTLQLARAERCEPGGPLDPETWARPSRSWASVTPVALPRNPGDLAARDPRIAGEAAQRAQEIVADACAHIGLPRPTSVRVMRRSRFPGVPPATFRESIADMIGKDSNDEPLKGHRHTEFLTWCDGGGPTRLLVLEGFAALRCGRARGDPPRRFSGYILGGRWLGHGRVEGAPRPPGSSCSCAARLRRPGIVRLGVGHAVRSSASSSPRRQGARAGVDCPASPSRASAARAHGGCRGRARRSTRLGVGPRSPARGEQARVHR